MLLPIINDIFQVAAQIIEYAKMNEFLAGMVIMALIITIIYNLFERI